MSADRKTGLGRGLGALMGAPMSQRVAHAPASIQVLDIPTKNVEGNPEQPRKHFEMERLVELSESIKTNGVIQPIIVRPINGTENFLVVAGERRLRASKLAGRETIPALVRKLDDKEMLEQSLIENIQRESLNPIEEAAAFKTLLDKSGYTQEQLAKRLGKSRSALANSMRMLQLPEDVKDALAEGRLSSGHARALLSLESAGKISELKERIVSEGLSVRDAEEIVRETKQQNQSVPTGSKKFSSGNSTPPGQSGTIEKPEIDEAKSSAEISNLAERMSASISAKTEIKGGINGGRIEIRFHSLAELNRIISQIIN